MLHNVEHGVREMVARKALAHELSTEPTGGLLVATVRKAGGSLALTVPAPARDALNLAEGQELNVSVEGDRLVFSPARARRRRSKYTLEELLAQCDFDQPYSEEERAWLDAEPVGREIL